MGEGRACGRGKVAIPPNGVVRMEAAGGGGYGDPLERDPQLVRADAVNGIVSLESAAREYGVALDPETLDVDDDATARLRSRMRQDPSREGPGDRVQVLPSRP